MTYAPQTITDLMAYLKTKGVANLGIVGDTRHITQGVSYHLGKDLLAPNAYSATLARDRAGLTNAASACDLGEINGSLTQLQKFSVWFVEQVRSHPQLYNDIREVIYSPDGVAVKRWDNYLKALRIGGDGTGQGDNTHRSHTHISFYRDSEKRGKIAMFAPYWEGETVEAKGVYEQPHVVALKSGTWLHWFSDLRDVPNTDPTKGPFNVQLTERTPEQLKLPYVLTYRNPKDASVWPWTGGIAMVAYEPTTPDANTTSRAMFVRSEDFASKPEAVATVAPAPPPQAPAVDATTVYNSALVDVINSVKGLTRD